MIKSVEQPIDYGPLFKLAGEIGRETDLSGLLLTLLSPKPNVLQKLHLLLLLSNKRLLLVLVLLHHAP